MMDKDFVTVLLDKRTYNNLNRVAQRKGKPIVDELSNVLENHITKEDEKFQEIHEGRKYLTEDR